mgnify:CR=1 FL=1
MDLVNAKGNLVVNRRYATTKLNIIFPSSILEPNLQLNASFFHIPYKKVIIIFIVTQNIFNSLSLFLLEIISVSVFYYTYFESAVYCIYVELKKDCSKISNFKIRSLCFCFHYSIVFSSINIMSLLLTTFLSSKSHNLYPDSSSEYPRKIHGFTSKDNLSS